MEDIFEIVKDCFIDLKDEGYFVSFENKIELRMGNINFKSPSIALEYISKQYHNDKVIIEGYYSIYISKGVNRIYKFNDFKNFNDSLLNSINNLANDINIDVSEFDIIIDNYQTIITFPISKIEVKNILKLNTIKKEFNRQYNGSTTILVGLKFGNIKLGISNAIKNNKDELDKVLKDINDNFEMDTNIQDKDIYLIPRFEWFKN